MATKTPESVEMEALPGSVYAEFAACLSGTPLPRAAAVYQAARQGVAIHSGYAGFTAGFDRPAVAACLARALAGRAGGGAVVLDADREGAWVASLPAAVDVLIRLNRHLVEE